MGRAPTDTLDPGGRSGVSEVATSDPGYRVDLRWICLTRGGY